VGEAQSRRALSLRSGRPREVEFLGMGLYPSPLARGSDNQLPEFCEVNLNTHKMSFIKYKLNSICVILDSE